ncbi:MAG: CPBP family intramembrane metalloprotease [Planctomycetes bacterium]|nr:CPBP family intramembrane metalloprotease [Planctomycetota bacterium]
MSYVLGVWRLTPTFVRAVLVGFVVLGAASFVWELLFQMNLARGVAWPWSLPIMGAYLSAYLLYLDGHGWPRSTSVARRSGLRLRGISGATWLWSLVGGFAALLAWQVGVRLLGRLVELPPDDVELPPELRALPASTVLPLLYMTSLVAGVSEEAAFRGYMQGALERRHGVVIAIAVTGVCFGLAHFTHGWMGLALMPAFLFASLVYGAMTYLSGSVLPAMVLHAAGDVLAFSLIWWNLMPERAPLVSESGLDSGVLRLAVELGASAVVAVVGFRKLLGLARSAVPSVGPA